MEAAQELAAKRADENLSPITHGIAVLAGAGGVAAPLRTAGRRGPLHIGELPARFGLGARARDRNLAYL
jgi:hypothetical protein